MSVRREFVKILKLTMMCDVCGKINYYDGEETNNKIKEYHIYGSVAICEDCYEKHNIHYIKKEEKIYALKIFKNLNIFKNYRYVVVYKEKKPEKYPPCEFIPTFIFDGYDNENETIKNTTEFIKNEYKWELHKIYDTKKEKELEFEFKLKIIT